MVLIGARSQIKGLLLVSDHDTSVLIGSRRQIRKSSPSILIGSRRQISLSIKKLASP